MPADWMTLADYVTAARKRLGYATAADLADAAGVSRSTVARLESGQTRARLPNQIEAIEQVLGWVPGTARRIALEGHRPAPERFAGMDVEALRAGLAPDFTVEVRRRRYADPRLEQLWQLRGIDEDMRQQLITWAVQRWDAEGTGYDPRGLEGEDWQDVADTGA